MLTQKTLISLIILGFLVSPVAGDIRFDDPDNVSFYTGLEFPNNNQIYGLGEPTGSNSPVRLQDVAGEYLNRDNATLNGTLYTNGNNIEGFFNNSCESNQAVKEIYDNGSLRCGQAGGNPGLPTVLDTNNSLNQNIDANGYQLGNLSSPVGSKSAVRQTDLAGYLKRTGGTLAGDLDYDGYNAELSGGYISNDGTEEGIRVQNNGDVKISDNLKLNKNKQLSGGYASSRNNRKPFIWDYGHNSLTWATERFSVSYSSTNGINNPKNIFDPGDTFARIDMANAPSKWNVTITGFSLTTTNANGFFAGYEPHGSNPYQKLDVYIKNGAGNWNKLDELDTNERRMFFTQQVGSTSFVGEFPWTGIRFVFRDKVSTSGSNYIEHLGFYNSKIGPAHANTYLTRKPVGNDAATGLLANLDMNSNRIRNIQNPSDSQDAATKNYVDTNEQVLTETDVEDFIFDTSDNNGNLGLNGGNIMDNSGNITLDGDTEVSNGNLNLNSNNVTNTQCLGDQC